MPADLPRRGSKKDRATEAAAADWLLDVDSPAGASKPPSDDLSQFDPNDVFELAESFGVDPRTLPLPPEVLQAMPGRSAPATATLAPGDQAGAGQSASVEEVWSRSAEWGPTLLLVGAWMTFTLVGFYIAWSLELYGTGLLALLAGGLIALVLSYPIMITLERPVRITPEQAVHDYYAALSHHLPHFRRMWLLLSTAGRVSAAFGSYEGFKAYWVDRLRRLRSGSAGVLTPLVFEILDFTAEKSAGKARIEAEFKVSVSVRGKRRAGALVTIPMKCALVRGPDKMWYLENGMLPDPDSP
jgi:hypothetical protein